MIEKLYLLSEIPKENLDNFHDNTIGVTALNSAIIQAEEVKLSDIADSLSSFKNYKIEVTDEIEKVIENYLDPNTGILKKN